MEHAYQRRRDRSDDDRDRGRGSHRDGSRDRRRSRSRSRRRGRTSRHSRSGSRSYSRSRSRSRSDSRKRESRKSPVRGESGRSNRRSRFADQPVVPPIIPDLSSVYAAQQKLQILAGGINNVALAGGINNAALSDLFGMGANSLLKLSVPVGPKESRELFVGNITPGASEVVVKDFLNAAMRQVGFFNGPAEPIAGCRMNAKFCFIECRTVEDCNNALNLNGIPFMGQNLKIARPSKYAGPVTPAKTWQELTGQLVVATDATTSTATSGDPSTKLCREIFIGNTSPETTDVALKEFIGGALQKMGLSCSGPDNPVLLVRANGRYSFAEFRTMEDAANSLNLNGIPFLGQALKLSRPTKFESAAVVTYLTWDELFLRWSNGDLKLMTAGAPSRVLRITNMVTIAELQDPSVYAEVAEDTAAECAQFGTVRSVIIPRPDPAVGLVAGLASSVADKGVGSVFVEMSSAEEATKALVQLKGRTFNARFVDVKFYPEDDFARGEYGTDFPKIVITAAGPTTIDKVVVPKASQLNLPAGVGIGTVNMMQQQHPSGLSLGLGLGLGLGAAAGAVNHSYGSGI